MLQSRKRVFTFRNWMMVSSIVVISMTLYIQFLNSIVWAHSSSNANNQLNSAILVTTNDGQQEEIINYFYGDPSDLLTSSTSIPAPIPEFCAGKQLSWIVASILSLALGGFGIDRMYLGYALSGVVKLFIGLVVMVMTVWRSCYSLQLVDPQKLPTRRKIWWLIFNTLVVFTSCIQLSLWLFDLITIMTGAMKDANGCPLSYNN
ncbi:hypothetical protein C9374_001576 [Naegleria lovaniensis]|uniref:TM2 domain-containing protein n=1 Tax=Naegleria lovaniensis TaxID=51637 RepID=A0AA88GX06_NAELO|nr:uncharacterized protein C9374_001576 [Naegleria lovaniensis]KAG2387244.1 hypothetical protein C9374_001576 [Naegleria lovaniensis]